MNELSGVLEILAERQRQIEKGYNAEHDKQHSYEHLVRAGVAYALCALEFRPSVTGMALWPFDKPMSELHDQFRCLSKAGAFFGAAHNFLTLAKEAALEE